MNPIVEVENLTKIYRLGILHGSYLTFRDAITQLFYVNHQKRKKHYIKALDNVNLTIEKGQKIGVIGKNGAGKSTFLKILSRLAVCQALFERKWLFIRSAWFSGG